jgi:hypothetical protein
LLKKPQTGTSRNKFCHLFHHLLHLVSMSFACRDTWVVNTTSILARSFVIISLLSVMADWVLKATVLSCEPRTVHEASGLPDLYAGNLNYAFVIRRRWIRRSSHPSVTLSHHCLVSGGRLFPLSVDVLSPALHDVTRRACTRAEPLTVPTTPAVSWTGSMLTIFPFIIIYLFTYLFIFLRNSQWPCLRNQES